MVNLLDGIRRVRDRLAVDGLEQITLADPRPVRRPPAHHNPGGRPLGSVNPGDAVVRRLVEAALLKIQDAKDRQNQAQQCKRERGHSERWNPGHLEIQLYDVSDTNSPSILARLLPVIVTN